MVLVSLILVAAVANLNLSVANVALPSIGLAFDASQMALNLVAVGYSLGLAASVLWLGALGDRYGRKLMLVLGVVLSIPACHSGRVRADDRDPRHRPNRWWHLRRDGLPDDPGIDRGTLVGSGPNAVDRALVRPRRGDRVTGSVGLRVPARAVRVGLGLPGHAATRRRRSGDGNPVRAGARQRDDGAGRQPGRRCCRRSSWARRSWRSTSWPVPGHGTLALRH